MKLCNAMTIGLSLNSDDQHLPVLDGLRGLAAYIVVISHVTNATSLGSGLLGFGAGQIGVMLFFVLSGFLMGALYLDRPFNRESVWHFSVRRFARVIPLYYIVITAALGFAESSRWLDRDFTIYPIQPLDLIYHYGLLSGDNVFWTIPVEIHFYAAFLIMWWLHSKSRLLLSLLVGAGILWFFAGQYTPLMPQFLDYIGYFLGGMAISLVVSKLKPGQYWNVAFIGAVVLSLLLFPTINARIFGQTRWPDFGRMWHDPLCLVAVSALLGTSLFAPVARFVLANRFMVYSGRISYSVYLMHVPVIIWLTRFTASSQYPFAFLLLALIITIIIASISYRWLECPTRNAVTRAAQLTKSASARGGLLIFPGNAPAVRDGDRVTP
jgi:peptidoglycan/LPS O-acetylase OafA/YrhL